MDEELTSLFKVEAAYEPLVQQVTQHITATTDSMEECQQVLSQVKDHVIETNPLLRALSDGTATLESIYAQIDALENIVSTIQAHVDRVEQSVEHMEKAIRNSSSASGDKDPLNLGSLNMNVLSDAMNKLLTKDHGRDKHQQLIYFPPPKPVEIYDTQKLFAKRP